MSRVILMVMKPVARLLVDVEQSFLTDLICSGDWQCSHYASGCNCKGEQTRPRDTEFYPYGTRVEHDPGFIEPFAGSYQTATSSGRFGLSGWTAPNAPVGSEATLWRETNGWFALGFSVTWDGPAARPAAAPRPPR